MPESGQGAGLLFKGSDTKAFSFRDLSILLEAAKLDAEVLS